MSENKYEINDYKSAFECFKQRFLKEHMSIFRLDDNENKVLTENSVKYLIDNFVNNGYSGDVSFIEKIRSQLVETPKDKVNMKNAIEILATAVWLWRVPPSNAKDRKSSVYEILQLDDDLKNINLENNPFFNKFEGFASTGTYYNTNKPTELAYIINFLVKYIDTNQLNEIDILTKNFDGKMQINTTKDYSYQDKKNKTNPKLSNNPDSTHDKPRTVSIHNALLHLFDSDNFEPILSNDHKRKIYETFSKIFKINEKNYDRGIILIKDRLKRLELIDSQKVHFFYDDKIKNIWQGGIDFESKNMILHGAPGTGKTYLTEEAIKSRKLIEKNSEYELVQFHPSYGYEDFIEGIKPTGLENGQMRFELKNGIFKQMCIDAFKNLIESQNDKTKLKTYYFIADEINRAELSRVFGELLLCLEDDKRLRIIDGKLEGTKIKTPSSNLWTKDDVVVFVDENDKIKEYLDDKKNWYFGVPENIYFIGTMNDIDRSVDSFDMALRRRFVWKQYRCDYEAIDNKYKEEKDIEAYVVACKNLNNHIIDDKGFNLSDSYELGQAYFMKPKNLTKKELDRVWLEHISPILKEYLRAEYSEKEIIGKLVEAQNIFKI